LSSVVCVKGVILMHSQVGVVMAVKRCTKNVQALAVEAVGHIRQAGEVGVKLAYAGERAIVVNAVAIVGGGWCGEKGGGSRTRRGVRGRRGGGSGCVGCAWFDRRAGRLPRRVVVAQAERRVEGVGVGGRRVVTRARAAHGARVEFEVV
jgi:hypothetical protein